MSLVGQRIQNLRVEELLGEGGMGTVYRCTDEKLERTVVLKTIRTDQLDEVGRARFLREARALSQLDHPNVCRIFDYLETEDQDYIVLEYIPGRTLSKVLEDDPTPRRRLEWAEDIARALVAAHEKGIVHRDLKLDNVMVSEEGVARVLDFGLAVRVDEDRALRALDPDAGEPKGTASPYRTERGSLVGTLTAMSPEQARGERATGASDMYCFGLLLQELFSGRPPYPADLSTPELVLRVAKGETEPIDDLAPPIRSLVEALLSIAPEARPRAEEALARLRHLRRRPVRRLWAAGVTILLAVLIAGVTKYTVDLRRARETSDDARREAEIVTGFLTDLFEVSDPSESLGESVTAQELLDAASRRVESELADEPRLRTRLMLTMGDVHRKLGLYRRAEELLRAAAHASREIDPQDAGLGAELDTALGELYSVLGDHDAAREALGRANEALERLHGPDHPTVLANLNELGTVAFAEGDYRVAEGHYLRVLSRRRAASPPDFLAIAETLDDLGYLTWTEGRYEEADSYYRRAVALREERLDPLHPDLATSLYGLALVERAVGNEAEAESLLRRVLEIEEHVLGPHHRSVSATLNSLGVLFWHQERFDEAAPLFERSLAILERALGSDHEDLVSPLNNLGLVDWRLQRLDAAERSLRRALDLAERGLGPEHLQTAWPLWGLANVLRDQGRFAEAEPLYLRALELRRTAFDPDHPDLRAVLEEYGTLLRRAGRAEEAEALFASR